MKTFIKSNSTLNDYPTNNNKKILIKNLKFSNDIINSKLKKKVQISLQLNSKKFKNFYTKINLINKSNICLLKKPTIKNNISIQKTRNKKLKFIMKSKSNIELFEKSKSKNQGEKYSPQNNNKNNYLILTSLYNLPNIEKENILSKKKYFTSILNDGNKKEISSLQNISKYNIKSFFKESLTPSNNKHKNNYKNLLNNYESIKINNRKKKLQKKIYLLSLLKFLLKNKYYTDTEKNLKEKINLKSFPYDHSMRDKLIYLKKFGAFWDSVLNYCVPIINVQKYKAQRDFSEKKRLNYLKLNNSK